MKIILGGAVVAFSLVLSGAALAADMPKEGKARCGVCHAIDKKLVGPAWMEVSKKYKGDAAAASKIAANVTKGGAFGWKLGTMPPKGAGATDAEIKQLSEFIAGLAN